MKNPIFILVGGIAQLLTSWFILMLTIWLVAIFFGAPLNFHAWNPLALGMGSISTFFGAIFFLNENENN